MAADTHKRRNCSYDLAEVPTDAYIVADQGGQMYFCNARCLSIWALDFATKPNRPEEQKSIAFDLTTPTREREQFPNVHELTRWAVRVLLAVDETQTDLIHLSRRLLVAGPVCRIVRSLDL